jgi:hypothetical protein
MATPYRDGDFTLGELVSTHARRRGGVLYGVFGWMAAAVGVWVAIVEASFLIGALIVAAAACATLVLHRMSEREDGETISLHERGVTVRSIAGDRSVQFDDVVSVTSGAERARGSAVETQRHIVALRAGGPIVFTLLHDDAADLLDAIHAATRERLTTEALRSYESGSTLRFGLLSLSCDGVRRGQEAVEPWSNIGRAAVTLPGLAVGPVWSRLEIWKHRRAKPFVVVSTDRVPNATVFVDVVRIVAARARQTHDA